MLRHILLIAAYGCLPLMAQVHVDAPIVLDGPTPADRQVLGLPTSSEADRLLSASTEQQGTYRVASVVGSTWEVTLTSLTVAPIAGTHIVVMAPGPSNEPVSAIVNGHGPYPLVVASGVPFDASTLQPGDALSLVSDGSQFHVVNGETYRLRPCPEGTSAVNDRFCAEIHDRPVSDFFQAISACGQVGLRLCGWGEFIVLCQNGPSIGLLDLTNGWEWVDDACNENGTARVVGAGGCTVSGTSLVTGSTDRGFRCCYSR
jgi:hypothetical protein